MKSPYRQCNRKLVQILEQYFIISSSSSIRGGSGCRGNNQCESQISCEERDVKGNKSFYHLN